jgi:hypothetical protein
MRYREVSPLFSPSFALCPEFSSTAKNSLQNIHLGGGHFSGECGFSETVTVLESAIFRADKFDRVGGRD